MNRRWARSVRLVAIGMGPVLVTTLLGAPALARATAPEPAAPRERSVPGRVAGAVSQAPDPAEERAVREAPTVTWPTPGSATVELRTAGAGVAARRVQAGPLPVHLGPPGRTADAPAAVRVDLLGRRDDGLLLRLARTDTAKAAGHVELEVDYSTFRHAFGGDWATRLRLVALPECAVTTPERADCVGTPIGSVNNGSGRLSGDVPATGLVAVTAADAGGAGDFRESSLGPSATWQAGGPSGDFTWSYPMAVPPALGGPIPQLGLSYSSGNVDGRTSGTNNQPSWVGEGFDLTPGGFIERRYAPCGSDMKNGASNTTKTGDLCWTTDNLTFSLNGHGGELVLDDTTKKWRPRVDDGSTVERLLTTATGNGDNDGEHWRITTRNGVQFYFGLNRLPGWTSTKPQTKSAWTVPVYGNHAGEPCRGSTFDTSFCQQAWRWNLDYVVDPHGDTASYYYGTELNNYARNLSASKVSSYTRAGWLEHIEYGQRDGEVYSTPWVGRVLFATADRCIPGTTCTSAQPANWPDVPWDRACTSTTSCPNKFSPTFWTQKRLATVTTQVWSGSAARDVDRWTFTQTYPDPGDGTKPRLWLATLRHTGLVGGTLDLPAVNFDGVQMNNRVDGADHIPAMNWWRMRSIRTEGGGEIAVTYSTRDCAYGTNLPAPATNGRRCHPVRWTPEGLSELTDWFNKYVVVEVSESDLTNGLEPEVSTFEYVGPAAWRHDEEDGLVPEARKTWSQWRGYERIRARKGKSGLPRSLTDTTYFRGMDGDKTATPGVFRDIMVVDSKNVPWDDTDQFAGMARETITYTGDGGTMLSRSITDPWLSPPTATRNRPWGKTSAYIVQENRVQQGETIGGQWRETTTLHTYQSDGTLTQQADLGNMTDPADDTCTTYTYATNPATHLLDLPSQKRTTTGACGRAPTGPDDVSSDERFYYDGSETLGAAPVRGDVTRRDEINGWSGSSPTYLTTTRASYDRHGRMVRKTDVNGGVQTIAFTPSVGAPVTRITGTNPLGGVTTTDVEPAWGTETAVTAPNGRRAEATYDALGRVTKTWLPGRDKTTQSPSAQYSYVVRSAGPSVVVASTLESDGGYRTEYKLLDGKMRLLQTQAPTPRGGRVVTDTVYDARGNKVKENGPYFNDAPPGTDLLLPQEDLLPAQTLTVYDGADRATAEIFKVDGVERWRTTYAHELDRQHTTPPAGETPTTRIHDAHGRLLELRQYQGATPTGAYDSTRYTYNWRGDLTSVTDAGGNVWRFFYDARGRKVRTEDPDQGVTQLTYTSTNNVATSTDGRGVTLAYDYDALGRRTAVRQGSPAGPKLAEWTFDRLADGTAVAGLPVSSTRFVNGHAYRTEVTAYDAANRVTRQAITIPSVEGGLSGRYEVTNTYRVDGELDSSTRPAIGGLPAETLRYGYNAVGLPTTLSGATSYVTGSTYTEYSEPEQILLSAGGKSLRRDFRYEAGTRRLSRAETRRETAAQLIASVTYQHDAAGNVTRISDAPDPGSGSTVDMQCFRHDSLRRLVAAWTPASGDCAAAPNATTLGGPAPYWHQWTIDKLGNRQSETRTAAGGATDTTTYTYDAARPHALARTSTGHQFGYDAAGNLTTRDGATLEWDPEGHLAKVTEAGAATSYVYDASGERLLRRTPTGATLYLGDTELRLDNATGTVTGIRYYQHGGRTVAMRHNGKITWLVSDHHGTAELAVAEADQSVKRQRHDPYGNTRGPGTPDLAGDRGFVGGKTDPTGLVHLGAREYDPTTGRFVSVDPVIDYEDPQQLHGYAYANNSPVSFSDPDGRAYVTRRVTTWRTVYRTVIRKIVEIQILIIVLWIRVIFMLLFSWWQPQTMTVVRRIIRYIRVLVKELVRITRLVRIYVKDPTPKNRMRLAGLGDHLDKLKRGLEAVHRALTTFAAIQRTLVWLMVKGVWHGGLMAAQKLLGFTSRFLRPAGFIQSRLESWVIGKLVEGMTIVTGGTCSTQHGMRVCHGGWVPYGGVGTTYGDTFRSKDANPGKNLIEHEKEHRNQWRKYGVAFAGMYLLEQVRTFGDECRNAYENGADLGKGGYVCP